MYTKSIRVKDTLNLGYQYFCDKEHPLATGNSGRVLLHRHIASIALGRWLTSSEHVHHIDGNKLNNDPSNLEVMTASEHSSIHYPKGVYTCAFCNVKFTLKYQRTEFCSHKCSTDSKVRRKDITKELLEELKPTMSWVALGKMFGYSDNGIRKRAKALGCIFNN